MMVNFCLVSYNCHAATLLNLHLGHHVYHYISVDLKNKRVTLYSEHRDSAVVKKFHF